jgi:hypothetical protein
MCLSTLWPKKKLRELQKYSRLNPIKGYKVVFIHTGGGYLSKLRGPYRGITYKTGYRVTRAGKPTIIRFQERIGPREQHRWVPKTYQSGIHVYAKLKDAERHAGSNYNRIIPCLIWDITAAGENGGLTYVAQKMMLLC